MPSIDLRLPAHLLLRVGGMATMPSRADSLRVALPHILPQVDRLFLYLDKHDAVPPEIAAEPRIVPMLPGAAGPSLGCSGKFFPLKAFPSPCLYFCFDDDIIYPNGYVAHLAAALRRHHYRCIVGLHGAIYRQPMTSYVADRQLYHFRRGLEHDVVVDELGTGTMAFHTSAIELRPERWAGPNMADLHVMIEAVRQETPRIAIRRPPDFIQPIDEKQDDSLYLRSLADDSAETKLLQAAMSHYPAAWCLSS